MVTLAHHPPAAATATAPPAVAQQQQPVVAKREIDIDIQQQYPGGSASLPASTTVLGGADGGLVSACRTLVYIAAAGGNTIVSAEFERTVLWRSRQRVETTSATWHAASGYLSLLSRNQGEQTLRHNLSTFARCVDLLGYRARSFGVLHPNVSHLKLIWRPQPSSATPPPGTFSALDTFNPCHTEAAPTDVTAPAVIVVHREERALAAPRTSQPDTLSYLLPRNLRGWQHAAGTNPEQPAVSMGTLGASLPMASMAPLPLQHHPQQHQHQYAAAATAQSNPMDNFPSVVYSSAFSLPPMRGTTSTLPPVRELANGGVGAATAAAAVQPAHDPQTASMLAYAFTGNAAHQVRQQSMFGESMSQALQWNPTVGEHTTATRTRAPGTGGVPGVSVSIGPQAALPHTTPQHGWKEPRRSRNPNAQMRSCTNCGTRQTRQWVRGERAAWLCHSCGQFWRKNGVHRPAQLWNRPTFKRSRRKRPDAMSSSTGSTSRASTACASAAASASTPAQTQATNTSNAVPAPSTINLPPVVTAIQPSTSVTLGGVEPLYRDAHTGARAGRGSGAPGAGGAAP